MRFSRNFGINCAAELFMVQLILQFSNFTYTYISKNTNRVYQVILIQCSENETTNTIIIFIISSNSQITHEIKIPNKRRICSWGKVIQNNRFTFLSVFSVTWRGRFFESSIKSLSHRSDNSPQPWFSYWYDET